MGNQPLVAALIPARGGSVGVPKKNIRALGGKPLIAWAIDVAKRTRGISEVLVSTDSGEIASVATEAGAKVIKRPPELATANSLVIDAVKHAYDHLKSAGAAPQAMVLLEPTCPFRSVEDISRCLDLLWGGDGLDSVATFCEAKLNPHRAWKIDGGKPHSYFEGATPWKPRQELPSAYQLSGGVYAFRCPRIFEMGAGFLFGKTGAVIVPPERSFDIDHEIDFLVAEAWLKRK
jgi:N-acylneuraminate cytidylyltransferase